MHYSGAMLLETRDDPVHVMIHGRVEVQLHDLVLGRGRVVCFMPVTLTMGKEPPILTE